ncbi:MAG: hypothetical protein GY753_11940 [Gammaproteobacteria bacterium]|nr:hypothetical protein [Gammaproteobacteria bacterium]
MTDDFTFTHKSHMSLARLGKLYDKAVDNGYEDYLFYDGGIASLQDWLEYHTGGMNWFCEVREVQGRSAGMFWLNGFQGRAAQVHFAAWRDYEKRIEATRAAMVWLHSLGNISTLYGCTPKHFKHVIEYIQAVGFRKIGEIPHACYIVKKDAYVPGVITVLNLNDLKGD